MMRKLQWAARHDEALAHYFDGLVGMFFKILPMREEEEKTLPAYIQSLQSELLGCSGLLRRVECDADVMSLVCLLQFFLDHPEASVGVYKREVFKGISLCKKIKVRYSAEVPLLEKR